MKKDDDEKLNRAAQFAPFDALKGLQEELRKREERRLKKESPPEETSENDCDC